MTDHEIPDFFARARERAKEQGIYWEESEKPVEFDSDLIPDPGAASSPESRELDDYLDRIDILDAYARWCGKMVPNPGSKRESIMISCPKPDHPDKTPSAWVNLDKQVWTCGTCGFEGGDKFDIAAYKFGFDVPGYKQPKIFPALKKKMVEDFFGVSVVRDIMGKQRVAEPLNDPEEKQVEPEQALAEVVPIRRNSLDKNIAEEINAEEFRIEWQKLVAPDTFLDAWMKATQIDDIPEEFYFWLGFVALGLACGRDVVLEDNPTVKGNLFLCLYADTSSGKSRAINNFSILIREAMPYDHADMTSRGSRILSLPGSPESLLDQFAKADIDDSGPAPIMKPVPIRALISINELALLVSRSARSGSDFRPVMQDLFDCYDQIEFTHKSRTKGVTYAERPFCSSITTTQTYSVKELMSKYDAISGFMNRWIYVRGVPKQPQIVSPKLDLAESVERLTEVYDWTRLPKEIPFEPEAMERWRKHFFDSVHPLKMRGDDMGLMARTDLILKKIIFLLTVNERLDAVPARIVDTALILLPWLEATFRFMGLNLNRTLAETHRELVLHRLNAWRNKHGDDKWLVEGKLFHHLPKDIDRFLLVKVIRNMIELGDIETSVKKSSNGKESKTYRLAL